MFQKIKEIELVFENTDSLKIKGEYVFHLALFGITKDIVYTASRYREHQIAESLILQIKKEANDDFYNFINEKDGLKFDRITNFNDIACIIIELEDGTKQEYSVIWNEENDYDNRYQKTEFNVKGNLLITISKNN